MIADTHLDTHSSATPPRPRLRSPWVWLLVISWLLLAALLAERLAGQALDDVFITYRYAQSFAEGRGLVFNPGERVFGTTAPGWALVLGASSWLSGVPVHVLGTVSTGVALVALVIMLWWEARRRSPGTGGANGHPGGEAPPLPRSEGISRGAEAAVAGTLVLTSTYLWIHNGLEVFPSLALLAAAARVGSGNRPRSEGRRDALAGLLAGAAVWLRPESGLAAGLLALLCWWRRRRLPWAYLATVAGVVTAGLAAATWWFGVPLPQTFAAKRLQAAWNADAWRSGLDFWPEAWRWLLLAYTGGPGAGAVLVAGGGAGLVVILRRGGDALRLLALYALTLLVVYPLLGVPFYTWYSIPVLVALTYGLVFATGAVVRALLPRVLGRAPATRPRTRLAAAAALAAAVLLAGWPAERTLRRTWGGFRTFQGMPRYLAYRATGEWLREHAPAGAGIAFVEVGTVGYFSRLPVRDLLGLVSPGVLPFVQRHDLAGAFATAPTAYVLDTERVHGLMAPIIATPSFAEHYDEVARFPIPGAAETVVIYQRRTAPGGTQGPQLGATERLDRPAL